MLMEHDLGGRFTMAQHAERLLRQAILAGDLPAGSRLLPGQLADAWSVSVTPVREAIHRLAADGLIEELPRRGARVKRLSREDLVDLYQLRLTLEPFALRRSVELSDDVHRDRISAAHDRLTRFGNPEHHVLDFEEAHRTFHRTLVERCGSQRLLGFLDSLSDQASFYRMLAGREPGWHEEQAHRDHLDLMTLCVAGDADGAADVLHRHIETTMDVLLHGEAMRLADDGASTQQRLPALG